MGSGASAPSSAPAWRINDTNRQTHAHAAICYTLKSNNLSCADNFSQANRKARDNGLISRREFLRNKEINRIGNNAKHNWS